MGKLVLFLLILLTNNCVAQNAIVSGRVIDENEDPVAGVSVSILGKRSGVQTSESGTFSIKVPAGRSFALEFSHTGFITSQRTFLLSENEHEEIVFRLKRSSKELENITVTDQSERKENSLIKIDPTNAISLPGATGGVEGLIKTLVGSNNELTSQYSVRGGNYDENLVYINDFEIYRPYLVSSGQQEGLSLINTELAKNVNFYTGGFQAKYGDKMSSVLDIQYKKPTKFGGSAYVSLLEQGVHFEGSVKNKFTYLIGIRNKSNQNVLKNQPTQGSYIPSSSDIQAYLTYRFNTKWQLEVLGILSASKFTFYPESVKKTSSVFSPFYTANIGLDVYFEGQEKDNYKTGMLGATLIYNPNNKMRLKWMLSRFSDDENENFDIAGAYLFGNRDFDNTSTTFGQIVNPLGAGYYQNYARNSLNILSYSIAHKGSYDAGKHFIQWGLNAEKTDITDKLMQFEFRDSAGYSLPYVPGALTLYNYQNTATQIDINRFSGYIQDNINFSGGKGTFTLQGGIRFNYNDLNNETLISPRVQASWQPEGKRNIVFKAAAGIYNQPPFYRELRMPDGSINENILAQKSIQFTAGVDYQLIASGKPFRIAAEAYYKKISDVVPYDIDNVKIRYLGTNNAKAYAAGVEVRIFGELVKGAESWLSIGLMKTEENLANDHYYNYLNAAGELITAGTIDKVIADSNRMDVGFVRRPSDRRVTIGLFLQDYLSTNKNFKLHLNALYGSNMSYNLPGNAKYRNGLIIEPYIRIDMGFSALLLGDHTVRRSHSPLRKVKDIWLSFEVFNIIDRPNTISFQLIKDYSNNTYAIPNRLTPRLFNLKLLTRF